MKKVQVENTLSYAVEFIFPTSGNIDFMMGKKRYQHIGIGYNKEVDGTRGATIEVAYDYKAMKNVSWRMSDEKIGGKEIVICKQ